MDYKINDICNDLGIGKSTIYKRIEMIKDIVPECDWKNNEYFYYTDNKKLFITEKGYNFIKQNKTKKDNVRHISTNKEISIYQNQIIEIYKQRIEYLENENKRLLDIISVKEQKELAKDIKYIGNNENISFLDKFFSRFKK